MSDDRTKIPVNVTVGSARKNIEKRRRNSEGSVTPSFPATGAKARLKSAREKLATKAVSDVSAKTPTAGKDGSFVEEWVRTQSGVDMTTMTDTTVAGVNLEFPPEMLGWIRVDTSSGGKNDCMIHAILTSLSPTYRRQTAGVKDTLAAGFRRGPFSQLKGLTPEETKRIEGTGFLESPELEKFSSEYGVNFMTIARLEQPARQDRAALIGTNTARPVYPIYNSNQTHFEAVRSPSGDYSLPYTEAEAIAKNFHPDTAPASPAPPTATTAPPTATTAPSAPPGSPGSPGSPPVVDDFGFIRLTDNVDPPDAIVHKFELKREGDTLKPFMQLMGSDPATPKIESLKSGTKERTRAIKKVLTREGKTVSPDSVIVGTYGNMEIPLFHFATDIEKFLDDPNVVSSAAGTILPPKSPLLVARDVQTDKAITLNLKSPIPEITFTPESAPFNNFYVGPVGVKDHRIALHGFLVGPVTATIKGRGPVTLQKGFEMVSILTGTLGSLPSGDVVQPIIPPEASAPDTVRGRSTIPRENVNATTPPNITRQTASRELVSPVVSSAKYRFLENNEQFKAARAAVEAARTDLENAGKEGETSEEELVRLTDRAIAAKDRFKVEQKMRDTRAKTFLNRMEKEYAGVQKIAKDAKDNVDKAKKDMKDADEKRKSVEKAYYAARDKANDTAAKPDTSNKVKKAAAVAASEAFSEFTKVEAEQVKAAKDFEMYDQLYQSQKADEDKWDMEIKKLRQIAKDPDYVEPTDVTATPADVAKQAKRSVSPDRSGMAAAVAEARVREQSPGRTPEFTPGSTELAERLGARGTLRRSPATQHTNQPLVPGTSIPARERSLSPERAQALGQRGSLGQPIVELSPAPAPSPTPVPATVPSPTPVPPECVRESGPIDDTFREEFRKHVRSFINKVKPGLLTELTQLESLNDKKLEDYLTSILRDHRGQAYTIQLPSETFVPSSSGVSTAQVNPNPGGGNWEIPPQCEMGGDIISILVDPHKWGNALVRKTTGGANPTGPIFAFKFELDYPAAVSS